MEENVFYNMLDRNAYFFTQEKSKSNEKERDSIIARIKGAISKIAIDIVPNQEKEYLFELLESGRYQLAQDVLEQMATDDAKGEILKKPLITISKQLSELKKLEKPNENKNKT